MASRRSCKAAPGTRPATCSRCVPSSWRRGARPRPRSRRRSPSPTSTTTASRAGGSTARGRSSMSTRKPAALVFALALGAGAALAQSPAPQTPKLGKAITEQDIQAWDIAVLPNGTGLPAGPGPPSEGAKGFCGKGGGCHRDAGKGGVAPFYPALIGGAPLTNGIETQKTIANYYAYPTTVFDYTRRGLPYNTPRSLSATAVYALTAYILSLNKLIGENDVMDAKSLPQVKMPNRDNFILPYPDRI